MAMDGSEDTKFIDHFDGGVGATVGKKMRVDLTSNSPARATQENRTADVGGSKKRSRHEEEEEGVIKKRSGSVGEDGNAEAECKDILGSGEAVGVGSEDVGGPFDGDYVCPVEKNMGGDIISDSLSWDDLSDSDSEDEEEFLNLKKRSPTRGCTLLLTDEELYSYTRANQVTPAPRTAGFASHVLTIRSNQWF